MTLGKIIEAFLYRENYERRVLAAAGRVQSISHDFKPEFGLTLGSGLGDIADAIDTIMEIDYHDIPHFPTPTVEGHEGKMVLGHLEGVPLIGLKGRKHYYEVADEPLQNGLLHVAFPIHVLAMLGAKSYFATNAVGGLNPLFDIGHMMGIKSHVNLIPNPLLGRHMGFTTVDGKPTERFQPMNNAYDQDLRNILRQAAAPFRLNFSEGVYLATTGPSYESEAESIAFRDQFGADAVGMSVAPEVIVARNRGMKCVALSCVTNKIAVDGTNATNHEEVKKILESPEVRNSLSTTVSNFFSLYAQR